jgi:hypothetical protein
MWDSTNTHLSEFGTSQLKLKSSWIWKAFTTPRIKYFLWLCIHHSLPTCEVLSIRGINVNPAGSMYNSSVESIIHILRDCPVAKAFWLNLCVMGSSACFFSSPLVTWLEMGPAPLPFNTLPFSPILIPIDDTWQKYDPTVKNKPYQTPFLFPFLFFFLSGGLTPKSHMSYPLLCLSFSSIFPLQLQHHHHHLNMAQREGDPSASFIQAKQK